MAPGIRDYSPRRVSHPNPPPMAVRAELPPAPPPPEDSFEASDAPPPSAVRAEDRAGEGSPGAPPPVPPTHAERAEEALAERVEHGGELTLAGTWTETEAAEFAESLAAEVSAHQDDPDYVRTLMSAAGPGLQRATEILQAASEENDFDEGALERTVQGLSTIAAVAPEEVGRELAFNLASGLADGRELHQLDDAFYARLEAGSSPRLFELTALALQAQGKAGAADELLEQGGGLTDFLSDTYRDLREDVTGLFSDVVSGAWEFGAEQVANLASLAGETADFVVDAASATLDVAGDVAELTAEQVAETVATAVERGLTLVPELAERARQVVFGQVYAGVDQLGIDDQVERLEPGDEVAFGGSVEAALGFSGSAEGDITVTRDPEGGYTISAGIEADLGVELGAGFDLGAGARGEFHVDSPQEAIRVAEALARFEATNLALSAIPGGAQVIGAAAVGPEDLALLTRSLSAVELSADISAGVGANVTGELGPLVFNEADASAGVEVETRVRVEFDRDEDGNLTGAALVREQTASADASAEASTGFFAGLGYELEAGAAGQVEFTVSNRVPLELDGTSLASAVGLVADVTGGNIAALVSGDVETSVSGSVTVDGVAGADAYSWLTGFDPGSDGGIELSFSAEDVDPVELGESAAAALEGDDLAAVLATLPNAELSARAFNDDDYETGVGVMALGQGVDIDLYRRARHYSERTGVTIADGQLTLLDSGDEVGSAGG